MYVYIYVYELNTGTDVPIGVDCSMHACMHASTYELNMGLWLDVYVYV